LKFDPESPAKPMATTAHLKWTKKPQQGLGALGLGLPDFREKTHPSIVVITIGQRIRFQQLPVQHRRRRMLAPRRLGLRPRRRYSTYTSSFQSELSYTVSDKRSDQNHKYRAFGLPPAPRRPELLLRIKTPAVPTTAGVFFICRRCALIGGFAESLLGPHDIPLSFYVAAGTSINNFVKRRGQH
jgi:hypothetical protein